MVFGNLQGQNVLHSPSYRIGSTEPNSPVLINCDNILRPPRSLISNDVIMVGGNDRSVGIGVFRPQAKLHLMPGITDGVNLFNGKDPYVGQPGTRNYVDFLMNNPQKPDVIMSDSGFYMYRPSVNYNYMLLIERNPTKELLIHSKHNLKLKSLNRELHLTAQRHLYQTSVLGSIFHSADADISLSAGQNIDITATNGNITYIAPAGSIQSQSSSFQKHSGSQFEFFLNAYTNNPALKMVYNTAMGSLFPVSVGIGTSAPKAHLQIADKWTYTDISGGINAGAWIGYNVYYRSQPSPGQFLIATSTSPHYSGVRFFPGGHIGFYTGSGSQVNFGVPAMTVFNTSQNGRTKVLIGIDPNNSQVLSNLKYELEVCGSVRAKEYWARHMTWCDYVFEEGYSLRPWEEVMEYVRKNKHLPGVMPAKEVEKQGLPMVEITKAQMEKIEELYLYLDEAKKEIERLKKRVEELEQQKQ